MLLANIKSSALTGVDKVLREDQKLIREIVYRFAAGFKHSVSTLIEARQNAYEEIKDREKTNTQILQQIEEAQKKKRPCSTSKFTSERWWKTCDEHTHCDANYAGCTQGVRRHPGGPPESPRSRRWRGPRTTAPGRTRADGCRGKGAAAVGHIAQLFDGGRCQDVGRWFHQGEERVLCA